MANDTVQQELQARIDFEKEAPNYQLHHFHPGVYAYRKKDAGQDEEMAPRYCEPCFENKQLSRLHATGDHHYGNRVYLCPKCKNKFSMFAKGNPV